MSGKKQSIFDEQPFVLDDNTLTQSVDTSADKATAQEKLKKYFVKSDISLAKARIKRNKR